MLEHIIFDLDGTLTDPFLGITRSVQFALSHFGISVENLEALTCFIGPPLLDSFRQFYGFTEEQAEEAVVFYRKYFRETGIFENEVLEGIPELLSNLCAADEQASDICGADSRAFFPSDILSRSLREQSGWKPLPKGRGHRRYSKYTAAECLRRDGGRSNVRCGRR